jgi:hypothetical protein
MQTLKIPLVISPAQLELMKLSDRLVKKITFVDISPKDIGASGGLPQISKTILERNKGDPWLRLCDINPSNKETLHHGAAGMIISYQYNLPPATLFDHHISTTITDPLYSKIQGRTNLNIPETRAIKLTHDAGADYSKHLMGRSQYIRISEDHEDSWPTLIRTDEAGLILDDLGVNPSNLIREWTKKEPEYVLAQMEERTARMLADHPILNDMLFPESERERVIREGNISLNGDGTEISFHGKITGFQVLDWGKAVTVILDLGVASDLSQISEAKPFMNPSDPRRRADVLRRSVHYELTDILMPDELKEVCNLSDYAFTRNLQEIVRKNATKGGLRAAREWINYCRNPMSVVLPRDIWQSTWASKEKPLPVPSLQRIGEAESIVREIIKVPSIAFDLYRHELRLLCLDSRSLYLSSAGFFGLNEDWKRLVSRFGGEEGWKRKGIFEVSKLINDAIEPINVFGHYVRLNEEYIQKLRANGSSYMNKSWIESDVHSLEKELSQIVTPRDLWNRS